MFNGFSDRTFEFFMALSFNNNTEFFHANHDWYLEAVREPCLQLASALSEVVADIDDEIELRPNRVVSRINRDLRFSKDKSPYRDYLWLRFRRPADPDRANVGFFFDISASGATCGMGFYEECRDHMNGLRRRMMTEPETLAALLTPLTGEYTLQMLTYKRMKVPEGLPEVLKTWYPLRNFWLYREMGDFELLKSPALVDRLTDDFRKFAPLYQYLHATPNELDKDTTRKESLWIPTVQNG